MGRLVLARGGAALVLDELRMLSRFGTGLPRFLRAPLDLDGARRAIGRRLAERERSFLRLVERGVMANPRSPYCALLAHAGVELGDLERLVAGEGLEGALRRLGDAGVRVSLAESRGGAPVVRGSLELWPEARDFDNPLRPADYEARSGGSRSAGRRVAVDLDSIAEDAAYDAAFLDAFGLGGRPVALWYPVPPGIAGLKHVLKDAKLRVPTERWFSSVAPARLRDDPRQALLTAYVVRGSRVLGVPVPAPEHAPPAAVDRVVDWLAGHLSAGRPPLLKCTPSSGMRVLRAAAERRVSLTGTFLRFGGEPYTPARAELVAGAACRACNHYLLNEANGQAGVACAAPSAPDEVHVCADKVAIVQRERTVATGETVGTLHITALRPSAPRILINVETDDFGVLGERDCGCPISRLGLRQTLHTIRSHEKLTSEGMSFLGRDVEVLVESVLPARFGGAPGDYQVVERQVAGVPRVSIVVSPAVGDLAAGEVVRVALDFLRRRGRAEAMMSDVWAEAGTLAVERREPYVTRASKLLPLHVTE